MRWCATAWRTPSTLCWTPRPTGSAAPGATGRSGDRADTRAGSYRRKLHTKAGEVDLRMPKLRSLPFETQIIGRYRRRESSVEEALMESERCGDSRRQMYLAGVSVRRVEDICQHPEDTDRLAMSLRSIPRRCGARK